MTQRIDKSINGVLRRFGRGGRVRHRRFWEILGDGTLRSEIIFDIAQRDFRILRRVIVDFILRIVNDVGGVSIFIEGAHEARRSAVISAVSREFFQRVVGFRRILLLRSEFADAMERLLRFNI